MPRRRTWQLLTAALAFLFIAPAAQAQVPACRTATVAITQVVLNDGCFTESATAYTATLSSGAQVNGLPMSLDGTLTLHKPDGTYPGGRLSASTSGISMALLSLSATGDVDWKLPVGAAPPSGENFPPGTLVGNVSTVNGVGLADLGASGSVLGFTASAHVDLRFVKRPAGTHYALLGLHVQLPAMFTAASAEDFLEDVTSGDNRVSGGDLVVRVENGGVVVDTAKIEVAHAYFGVVELAQICISYVGAGSAADPCDAPDVQGTRSFVCPDELDTAFDHWDGTAEVKLPGGPVDSLIIGIGINTGTTIDDLSLRYARGAAQTSIQLFPSLFLDHIDIGFCLGARPYVRGGVGIRFGPTVLGRRIAALDGTVEWGPPEAISFADDSIGGVTPNQFWDYEEIDNVLAVSAEVKFLDLLTLSSGYFALRLPSGEIDFAAQTSNGIPHFLGYTVGFTGYMDVVDGYFAFSGHGDFCIVLCASGEAIISDVGWGACAELTRLIRFGFGQRWDEPFETFGRSCDIGEFRSVGQGNSLNVVPFTVAEGQHATSLRVTGENNTFTFKVTGPNGREFIVSGPKDTVTDDYAFTRDPYNDKMVDLIILNPEAGSWQVRRIAPGRIKKVEQARVEPLPKARGHVSGYGRNRVLDYEYPAPDGIHAIKFVETGTDDAANPGPPQGQFPDTTLGPANGSPCPGTIDGRPKFCGSIPFSVPKGVVGRREIKAVIVNVGDPNDPNFEEMPTDLQDIASYQAPVLQPPSRPRPVRVRRQGSKVVVSWGASRRATEGYRVTVTTTDGRNPVGVFTTGNPRRMVIQDVASTVGVTATVVALGVNDEESAPVTVSIFGRPLPEDL